MNKINPKKLLNSKWTAMAPANKEKHFIVSSIDFDENDAVLECYIEAVMTKRMSPIDWHDLEDDDNWVHGWK
jgi:tryptophan-rich hypothetical protein